MKSYYLYFVLLVFCSSKCCGWDYQGDEYVSTGKEVIYLLEGTNGNSIILHNEVYDQINTCDGIKTVASPMFLKIYSFEDSTNKNRLVDLDVSLYSQNEQELLETVILDGKTPYYKEIEDRLENAYYEGVWKKMSYRKFEENDNFVLEVNGIDYQNNSALVNGVYSLSSSKKMYIEKNYNLNNEYYSTKYKIELLQTEGNYKKVIRMKNTIGLNASSGGLSFYMSLYQNTTDSSVFITNSAFADRREDAFLIIPNSDNSFDGYIEIKQPYRDFDSTMLTIPIRF